MFLPRHCWKNVVARSERGARAPPVLRSTLCTAIPKGDFPGMPGRRQSAGRVASLCLDGTGQAEAVCRTILKGDWRSAGQAGILGKVPLGDVRPQWTAHCVQDGSVSFSVETALGADRQRMNPQSDTRNALIEYVTCFNRFGAIRRRFQSMPVLPVPGFLHTEWRPAPWINSEGPVLAQGWISTLGF